MHKVSILILFFFFTGLQVKGTPAADSILLRTDTCSILQLRMPAKPVLDSLKQQKEFNYSNKATHGPSFLEWLFYWLQRLFGKKGVTPEFTFPAWLTYLLVGAIAIFLLYRILTARMKSVFYSSINDAAIGKVAISEDVHSLNFDELIVAALKEQDYRKGIRYLYLKLLKKLSDKECIKFRKEKSNREYAWELDKTVWSASFVQLTNVFEWVWYGQFIPDVEAFDRMRIQFETLYARLDE